ncbi:NAD(P)H-hydrate dehydratase [Pseudomonas sp.]|uniref:NAD(P)H-hydrate dehydratase n=1 Tax=Pseudomonas sp. TaxID=306 RepID=UPI00272C907C|nr:NAD(P)H-hydrate dehydratase [Pseudomonas sp.]
MAAPSDLPCELYSSAQTRQLDASIIASGISGGELMQRAAEATWKALVERWPDAGRLTVFCGAGNNAGDGYLIAVLAQMAGWEVDIYAVGQLDKLSGDAAVAMEKARRAGVDIWAWHPDAEIGGILLDALLGTGLSGPVREPYASVIASINQAGLPVVAVDVPSGLDADRGIAQGCAVRADLTVTFITLKPGLFTAAGPDQVGKLVFAALADLPASAPPPLAERLDMRRWRSVLPPRARASHKGSFGHLVLLGGDHGMGGAIILAAETALRSGAGKVTVLTRAEHVLPLLARCPEVMVRAIEEPGAASPLLDQATCLVVGPGLGRSEWGRALLEAALSADRPCVLDADALNMLAQAPALVPLAPHCIMTPHPAEASRLLGCGTSVVQGDRLEACRQMVQRYGCTVVLKGVGSLIGSPAPDEVALALCSDGNPGMAAAGMGDVLSGLVGALLAQGLEASQAARYGVLVHALAGDVAAKAGQRGVLASDLIGPIRTIINGGAVNAEEL